LLYGIGEVILETLVGYERSGYPDCGAYIIIELISIEVGLLELSLDVMFLC